jgi:hypothetical protein
MYFYKVEETTHFHNWGKILKHTPNTHVYDHLSGTKYQIFNKMIKLFMTFTFKHLVFIISETTTQPIVTISNGSIIPTRE